MSLLRVDASLLDLHDIDEDESEAVALAILECLFAETNVSYRQHCLANLAVQSTASLLASSVFDAVRCSQLGHEASLELERFIAEPSPLPEINDRHAVWSLPQRSPQKLDLATAQASANSPTQRTRPDSLVSESVRMSFARKRPSPDKRNAIVSKAGLVTIPQTIALPDISQEENPEDKAWRDKCLKELSGGRDQLSKLGKSSKWGSFIRQTPAAEPRVSLDVEIIDSTSPLLRQEVMGSSSTVKMKSSLNTFSAISNNSQRSGSAGSSISPNFLASEAKQRRLSGSPSVSTILSGPAKTNTLQLNDSLSRKRPMPVVVHHHGSSTASTADSDPWQFQLQTTTPRTTMRSRFTPDMMVASAANIPTTISLAAGVDLKHGDSTAKGPLRRENDNTMSKKRFELHQRLATDHLMQESMLLHHTNSSTHPPVGSRSPNLAQSQHQCRQVSPRPYETVPAEPLPMPSLSPIAKGTLTIPHKHLSQSASTPSLRVRNPSMLKRGVMSSSFASTTHPLVTNEELDVLRKSRPPSALSAVVVTTPRQMQQTRDMNNVPRPKSSSARESAHYMREFPKPHSGTIKLNAHKGAMLNPGAADVDSARQRMAWIS